MFMERFFFDREDHELLEMVKRIESSQCGHGHLPQILDESMHPHGVKNLVCTPEFRIAHAIMLILTSKKTDHSASRLAALRALHDESMASSHSTLRINTARALMQIMKDMVARKTDAERLKLAREFRRTAKGTPRLVRHMLMRYHLLEMPESWNQLVFDDHVHDAHSTGIKTPTRLIMDAWIKGIRHITVAYCDHIRRQAVEEVLQAAEIVGITARVAVQFGAQFRGKKVRLLWIPHGFSEYSDFIDLIEQPEVAALMTQGKELAGWKGKRVQDLLDKWNLAPRREMEKIIGIDIPPVAHEELKKHVGEGQASLTHLLDCLHGYVLTLIKCRAAQLQATGGNASMQELQRLDSLNCKILLLQWLPDSVDAAPHVSPPPELYYSTPAALTYRLAKLLPAGRVVLGLADLAQEDVLELLWDCQGRITHLELFNARHWHEGRLQHLAAINALRRALNSGDAQKIRLFLQDMTQQLQSDPQRARQLAKFRCILGNLPLVCEFYRKSPLKCHMGSASASREAPIRMGLAVPFTLPPRARKAIRRHTVTTTPIPIKTELEERKIRIFKPRDTPNQVQFKIRNWSARVESAQDFSAGNMVSLAGPQACIHSNGLLAASRDKNALPGFSCLSTPAANCLKILSGFAPAALTFWYTQQWWFLAWFGAWIWFAVTGLRNAFQMVISAKGGSCHSLLKWKDQIDIGRLSDSLFYTGISVVILEAGIRIGLLEHVLGVSVQDQPLLVFTTLNLINGLYISAHNLYRGFPRAAVVGNLFRSTLAIPVSGAYNIAAVQLLAAAGVADPLAYVIPCAAVISKIASDTIAAVIEGYADSRNNRRMRHWDYAGKLEKQRDANALHALAQHVGEPVSSAAASKPGNIQTSAQRNKHIRCIHALDLMYFWFYQPRAQEVFSELLHGMSRAERKTLARQQLVLCRRREISRMLIDGSLVGDNYRPVLIFYINHRHTYLRALFRMVNSKK